MRKTYFKIFKVDIEHFAETMLSSIEEVEKGDYHRLVYQGSETFKNREINNILEDLFAIINIGTPKDYLSPLLSVGDIVTIDNKVSYICRVIGWEKMNKVFK